MRTFKVNESNIENSINELRKIKEKCEEAYNEKLPFSDVDRGKTHNELDLLCKNIKNTFYCFGELINRTIQFLGETGEMFERSDEASAKKIGNN